MKGIVIDCLKNLVSEHFGTERWNEVVRLSGASPDRKYEIADDVDEELVLKMFAKTCEVAGLSFEQACDAFGDYWVGSYIPKLYPDFYAGVKSAREFLLKLDNVHATIAARLPNAKPPRHSYQWKSENTLAMSYSSERDLIELFIGAIKGAAKYFKEEIQVRKIDRQSVEIDFHPSLSKA